MGSGSQLKESNLSIYILKAICACFVVFIHIPDINNEVLLILPFIRIAVPCFFMISGFYLVSGEDISALKVKKQIIRILKVIIFSNAIYLIYWIISNVVQERPILDSSWLTLRFWGRWLLVGDNICYPLWYLTSYMQVLLIIRLVLVFRRPNFLYILIPVLLILCVLLNRYSFVWTDYHFNVIISRNSLLCALPCVLLGAWIHKNIDIWRSLQFSKIILSCFIIVVMAYIEMFLLSYFNIDGSGADFNLLTYPLTFITFIICLKYPNATILPSRVRSLLVKIGQKEAINIYLYHVLVASAIGLMSIVIPIVKYLENAECVIVICILGSLLVSNLKRVVCRLV